MKVGTEPSFTSYALQFYSGYQLYDSNLTTSMIG